MAPTRFRHLNNCPRCPVLGAEDHPGVEYFQALSLRFHVPIARELCRESMLHRVEPTALKSWLEGVHILPAHLYHLPPSPGPGIMVTLPSGLGRPVIDGNHRAARTTRWNRVPRLPPAGSGELGVAAPKHGPCCRRRPLAPASESRTTTQKMNEKEKSIEHPQSVTASPRVLLQRQPHPRSQPVLERGPGARLPHSHVSRDCDSLRHRTGRCRHRDALHLRARPRHRRSFWPCSPPKRQSRRRRQVAYS